jgi:GAF domain-containing protein
MAVALISELETGLPQRLEIVALWNQPDHPASLTERTMVAKEYSFLSQLNPHENVLINYETLDEKTQNKLDQSFGQARSILIIPLQVSHTWLGVLFLVSRQTDFVFKHQLVTQITTLAGQMAVIIQNLQLVQETQKTLYNSEVLSHLSQELLGADTQEAIYELGLEAIGATEPERGAAIFLYEDTTHTATMKLVAQWVDLGQDWPQVELGSLFSIEELSLQALLSIGKTVIARQATTDERF